jgi:hypothetical protein
MGALLFQKLSSSNFSECSGITDAGLRAVQCPSLANAKLTGCEGIPDAGLGVFPFSVLTSLKTRNMGTAPYNTQKAKYKGRW